MKRAVGIVHIKDRQRKSFLLDSGLKNGAVGEEHNADPTIWSKWGGECIVKPQSRPPAPEIRVQLARMAVLPQPTIARGP